MKKFLIVAFMSFSFLLMGTLSGFAQMQFGATAGLNIANLSSDDDDFDMDSRTGIFIGVYGEMFISDNFSFQPGLIYSMKGAKPPGLFMDDDDDDFNGFFDDFIDAEVTMKFDYLDIPLMFNYYVSDGFYIQAGPQLSVLLSAEVDMKYSVMGISGTETEDIKDETKGLDLSFGIGAGYKSAFGLGFFARYSLGLMDINDVDGSDFTMKNNVIQIGLSYSF